MRLKKIKLKNIRSYKEQEIEFKEGSTLLAGDIGAGKTSILLGIEFALFGLQPGQRGNALLRNGEDNGGVVIEFEVDDQNIIIERTLKRGKTISQDYCAIIINNERKEIAVTELKNKVLELLSYPKEFSKKQNILYKFTVYTPQEEMKQIILQDAETRINTLRHVFGIDKYKKIIENNAIVASKLREEKRLKEGMTANLEQDKLNITTKESELILKQENLVLAEGDFLIKSDKRKTIQTEREEISKKREEKLKLRQEIEKTKIMISTKNETITNNSRLTQQLILQINELKELTFDESKITELEQKIAEIKKQKLELSEKNLDVTSKISSFTLKNQENENTKNKISKLEMCPTCLQDVDSIYKSNVVNKMDANTSENINQIKDLTLKKTQVVRDITRLDVEISEADRQIQDLKMKKVKLQGIHEKQSRLEELEKSNALLQKDAEMLAKHNESLQFSIFELSKFDSLFEAKQRELDEALKQERLSEIKSAELKREIEVFSKQIQELKERVQNTEKIRSQLEYLTKLEDWLTKKFNPIISFIEKNVMVKLKSEFSQLFNEWFKMLVSDSFEVRLDDDFTPIIEHQDYEIDYAYLSGGERTAVALAYRLALNQVINSLLSKIKTRDLVILDEPTDGFSEQQLDKMREVLDQLNVAQLIIVSHEQKIEGFVENVMKLRKQNGISGADQNI